MAQQRPAAPDDLGGFGGIDFGFRGTPGKIALDIGFQVSNLVAAWRGFCKGHWPDTFFAHRFNFIKLDPDQP